MLNIWSTIEVEGHNKKRYSVASVKYWISSMTALKILEWVRHYVVHNSLSLVNDGDGEHILSILDIPVTTVIYRDDEFAAYTQG